MDNIEGGGPPPEDEELENSELEGAKDEKEITDTGPVGTTKTTDTGEPGLEMKDESRKLKSAEKPESDEKPKSAKKPKSAGKKVDSRKKVRSKKKARGSKTKKEEAETSSNFEFNPDKQQFKKLMNAVKEQGNVSKFSSPDYGMGSAEDVIHTSLLWGMDKLSKIGNPKKLAKTLRDYGFKWNKDAIDFSKMKKNELMNQLDNALSNFDISNFLQTNFTEKNFKAGKSISLGTEEVRTIKRLTESAPEDWTTFFKDAKNNNFRQKLANLFNYNKLSHLQYALLIKMVTPDYSAGVNPADTLYALLSTAYETEVKIQNEGKKPIEPTGPGPGTGETGPETDPTKILKKIYKLLSELKLSPSINNNTITTVNINEVNFSNFINEISKISTQIFNIIKFNYDQRSQKLIIWIGDIGGLEEQNIEDEYAKSVQASLLERKDRGKRDSLRNHLMNSLKGNTKKRAEKIELNDVTERNKFIDESVSEFLELNNSITDKRIEHKEKKHSKLYRKIRNGLSDCWKKWRKQKWWVKVPLIMGVGIGGAAIAPAWSTYIGYGLMGLGAAALQPGFRTLGYRGVKKKGWKPGLADYSLEGASDFTARAEIKEGMTEPPGAKGTDVLRSQTNMNSYHNTVSTRIKERVNEIANIDKYDELEPQHKEEVTKSVIKIMNEEFEKIWKSIEKQRDWLLARRIAEGVGSALGIFAIGQTAKAAIGGVAGWLGFGGGAEAGGEGAAEGTATADPETGGGAEGTPEGGPEGVAEVGAEGTPEGTATAEPGGGAEAGGETAVSGTEALSNIDAEIEAPFYGTTETVYDPDHTLVQYDDTGHADFTHTNESVSITNGTEVEVATKETSLTMRTANGEIIGKVPKGSELELTGETKTFEITNSANNSEKITMKYFEAQAPNGQKGYFAGSFLKTK